MRVWPRRVLSGAVVLLLGLAGIRPARAIIVERIVAVVGDRSILLSDLRARAKPFLIQIQQNAPAGAQQTAAESQMFKDLLEKMIEEELEAQAADKAHLAVTPDEVDRAVRNIAASQNLTVPQLLELARDKSFLTEQEYRDEIRRQIIEGKLLQLRVKGRVRITEEDLRAMYERMVKEEKRRREYHPAWIVLRVLPGSSPRAALEREQLAEQLAERARRGEDFAALAQQYSDDTGTRDRGGDLGIRTPQGTQAAATGRRAVLGPELEAVAMALEPNQVSAPIRVGENVIVIKLLTRQPSRYTTYDAAKEEMMQLVQADILGKAKRKWIDELKGRTHLEVRL